MTVAEADAARHPRRMTSFLLEDAGDGWWHCPSPLRCEVVAGPAPAPSLPPPEWQRFPETFWLVRTDPAIEWRGDSSYADRWGPDHPLCHPIEATRYALVMASSRYTGPMGAGSGGVPAYPVAGAPSTVAEAEPIRGLGIKASVTGLDGPA
jgi:hypothetical protein